MGRRTEHGSARSLFSVWKTMQRTKRAGRSGNPGGHRRLRSAPGRSRHRVSRLPPSPDKEGLSCRVRWFTSRFRRRTRSVQRASGEASSGGRSTTPDGDPLLDDTDRGEPGRRDLRRRHARDHRVLRHRGHRRDDRPRSTSSAAQAGRQDPDPARRLVRALHRHRGQRVQPLPERRIGLARDGGSGGVRGARGACGLGAGGGDGPLRPAHRRLRGAHLRDGDPARARRVDPRALHARGRVGRRAASTSPPGCGRAA